MTDIYCKIKKLAETLRLSNGRRGYTAIES